MNSTPADSRARRTAKSFAVVSEVESSVASARLIVFTPKDECLARSCALHLNRARADLIWAPVNAAIECSHLNPYGLFTPTWVDRTFEGQYRPDGATWNQAR
jgi:hypothetical protein